MGLTDFLFARKELHKLAIRTPLLSPINGELLPADVIPDPTFSQQVLGPTICFKPGDDGTVYSPCNGVVTQIFNTAHAITLTSSNRVEVLIHVGINTVDLKGEGFQALVKDDEEVKVGQPLIRFDKNIIQKAGLSDLIPFVICNANDFQECKFTEDPLPKVITTADEFCFIYPKE